MGPAVADAKTHESGFGLDTVEIALTIGAEAGSGSSQRARRRRRSPCASLEPTEGLVRMGDARRILGAAGSH